MMTSTQNRLIVFAKAPRPGIAKTRLIPLLGAEAAAQLHATLVEHTMAVASKACTALELHVMQSDDAFLRACAERHGATLAAQCDGDLGARMHAAFEAALPRSSAVVLIGCDCPILAVHHLQYAFRALAEGCDAVFSPTEDGGYALIGLRRCDERLFSGIAWSTATVMEETRSRLRALGWSFHELETLWDVDRPADYQRLRASGLLQGC